MVKLYDIKHPKHPEHGVVVCNDEQLAEWQGNGWVLVDADGDGVADTDKKKPGRPKKADAAPAAE